MKKDKELHQSISEATPVGDLTSSASITLHLLNKEKEKMKEIEKKESDAEAVKVRCRVCFKEIAPTPRCFGHGGGGGGGGGDGGAGKEAEEKSQGQDKSPTSSGKIIETSDGLNEFASIGENEDFNSASDFDPDLISELIDKGLLLVDSDRESMTLIIKLLCEPNELTEEQRKELKKFMEAILREFNNLKEENNLPENCITIIRDEKGNISSLRITMPTLALYDALIQRLANNLVPIPSLNAQQRDDAAIDRSLALNPFSKEPRPSNKTIKEEELAPEKNLAAVKTEPEEEEQVIFNPSPFTIKYW